MRFGGFAPIKAVVSHTLNSVSGSWDGSQLNLRSSSGAVLWGRTRPAEFFASRLCIPSSLMVS